MTCLNAKKSTTLRLPQRIRILRLKISSKDQIIRVFQEFCYRKFLTATKAAL